MRCQYMCVFWCYFDTACCCHTCIGLVVGRGLQSAGHIAAQYMIGVWMDLVLASGQHVQYECVIALHASHSIPTYTFSQNAHSQRLSMFQTKGSTSGPSNINACSSRSRPQSTNTSQGRCGPSQFLVALNSPFHGRAQERNFLQGQESMAVYMYSYIYIYIYKYIYIYLHIYISLSKPSLVAPPSLRFSIFNLPNQLTSSLLPLPSIATGNLLSPTPPFNFSGLASTGRLLPVLLGAPIVHRTAFHASLASQGLQKVDARNRSAVWAQKSKTNKNTCSCQNFQDM